MSVAENQLRSIDGQNTLICDSIDINEEILLGGDNGNPDDVIFSDGTNARWRHISTILVAGDGIDISASQVISTDLKAGSGLTITATELDLASIPNSALTSSTISGRALGTNLQNLTAGTHLAFSSGSTYNGGTALTLNATNTTYTAGNGLNLSVGNEFTTDLDNLTAGANISFSSGTTYDGLAPITISSTDTNTTYTAGEGLNLAGTTFSAAGYLPSNVDWNSGLGIYTMAVLPSMAHSTDNTHSISNSGGVDDGWLKVSGHSLVFNIKIPGGWQATNFYMSLYLYSGGTYTATTGANMYVSKKSNITMLDTPSYNSTKTDNQLITLSPVITTDIGEMMNIEINGIPSGNYFSGGGYLVIAKT